jgi:site-specific recombinase XerD
MTTLWHLMEEYLERRKALNFSNWTLRQCRYNLRRFLRWLASTAEVKAPDRIRRSHLETWQRHLAGMTTSKGRPLKAGSVNKQVENLRGFLKHLASHGYVPPGLTEAIELVKEPKLLPGSVLTHQQMRRLLEAVPTGDAEGYRFRTMLELLYSSGIRAAELLGLDVGDVDFRQDTALVTGKGQKQRVVPFGKTARRYLEGYIGAVRPHLLRDRTEKALFLDEQGRRFPYHRLRRLVHAYAAKAGLDGPITPHTFRRSCTTEMLRAGAGMYHVKELLGHESLDTLQHYARLTILDLKKTHRQCHPRERDDPQKPLASPDG